VSLPVSVDNLAKTYAGLQPAVDGISFVAEPGRITTLLGPSGCGKTTTLRCIAGLETPSGGEIRFGERRIFSATDAIELPTERRGLGMIFQNYALWPHMTVGENVAFGLAFHNIPGSERAGRVRRALDLVRLGSRIDALPATLSGGQQQRVALARALAYDPEILLLDEPLANLDAKLREAMRYELLEVQDRTGLTAIYVTHDQAEAMSISAKVIVMHDGRISDQGAPRDIYEHPKTRFAAEFVGTSNFIEVRESRRQGDRLVAQTGLGELLATVNGIDTFDTFMIRPEDIRLITTKEAAANNIAKGTVTRQIYQGEYVVLLVQTAAGPTLRIHVPRGEAAAPGSTVALHLPPDRLVGVRN
jgi:ABC-type Fe3+/spermidine/putrescine transport system ATPase subunit